MTTAFITVLKFDIQQKCGVAVRICVADNEKYLLVTTSSLEIPWNSGKCNGKYSLRHEDCSSPEVGCVSHALQRRRQGSVVCNCPCAVRLVNECAMLLLALHLIVYLVLILVVEASLPSYSGTYLCKSRRQSCKVLGDEVCCCSWHLDDVACTSLRPSVIATSSH
jgi:hypothetical protein